MKKKNKEKRYTNSKYCVAFNFTFPSFLARFSVLTERAFILRSRMRGKPPSRYAGKQMLPIPTIDPREIRRSVGIKWKKSNRREMPSPFSFGALYSLYTYLSLVGCVYRMEFLSVVSCPIGFPRIGPSRITRRNAIKRD